MADLIYGVGRSDMEGVLTYQDALWAAGQFAAQVEAHSGRDLNGMMDMVEGMKPGDKVAITRDGITFWIECKQD